MFPGNCIHAHVICVSTVTATVGTDLNVCNLLGFFVAMMKQREAVFTSFDRAEYDVSPLSPPNLHVACRT